MADRAAFVDPFAASASSAKPAFVDPFASQGTAPEAPRNWSDVPGEAISNIPSDLYDTGAGIVKTGVDVAKAASPYAKYGPAGAGVAAFDAAKAIYNDPSILKKLPTAVWNSLVDSYGSEDAIKRTIAVHPVKFGLDLMTVLGGGEAALSRVVGGVSDIGKAADVSRPFFDVARPAETPPPVPAEPPPLPSPVQDAIRSQPRALTTDSRFQQQAGQVLSKIPLVGDNLGKAIEAVPEKFGEARNAVADELGDYRTPQNVASDIGSHIGGAAETETAAAQAAARQTDDAARTSWEQTNQERERYIRDAEARASQEATQQVGDVPTTDMGQTIIDTVRANHGVAEARKNAAYADAGEREGTLYDPAVGRADRFVNADLRSERGGQGVVDIDPTLTPAASRMQDSLTAFSERARQRVAQETQGAIDAAAKAKVEFNPDDVNPTGINLRAVERQRQILNAKAQNAATPGDRRAAGRIMNAFDEWQQRAMSGPHFDGDPDALAAFQRARAENRDFRQRFGYNDRNDADTLLNRVVQPGDQVGANEIASGLTGAPDKGGRLLDAVYGATGDHPNHPNVVQAVRGGFWNKLAGTVEGATDTRTPTAIQKGIRQFTRGTGRDVAARIFTPEDQALMERHGDVLAAAERARPEIAAQAKATEPVATEVPKGPAQELADRVLGRGQKPDEALYDTIEGYAKSKGGGKDIATLAKVVGSIPEDLRGNLRNTLIRRLGTGLKGDFSPAKFADEWSTKINPQAKAVLFGDGAHVKALDDLAAASKQFDQVHRRFGNPSGSGQAVNFAKVAATAAAATTGAIFAPAKLLGGWFLGRQFANLLATPAGAASASRFVRQMQRLQDVPTVANAAAARLSVRNLRNTATALDIPHNIPDTRQQ